MVRTVAAVIAVAGSLVLTACSSDEGSSLGGGSSSGASSGGASSGGSSTSSGGGSTTSSSSSSSSSSSGSSSSGGVPLTAGKTTRTIETAGKMRSVIVVVPAAAAGKRVPLVIALHGNGDTNTNFLAFTGFEALAASKGFVLAAPQGITQTVMVGAQTIPNVSWDAYRTVAGGNIDIPLVDAIRAELVGSGSIDDLKVFTYGYSQGGYLSFRYAMEQAASVSCGAVLAAANPLGSQLVTGAARKVPISMQIGTSDFGITNARNTKALLEANGFPLDYHEIQGAGHVPIPGDKSVPLDYCLKQALP